MSNRTQWVDRVFSKDGFRQEFSRSLNAKLELTGMDIDVLLTYLARDRRMIAYDGQVSLTSNCLSKWTDVHVDHQIFNVYCYGILDNLRRHRSGFLEDADCRHERAGRNTDNTQRKPRILSA